MSAFDYALFDFDGTLIDPLDDIHEALVYTFNQYNLSLVDKHQTRISTGHGLEHLLKTTVKMSLSKSNQNEREALDWFNDSRGEIAMTYKKYYEKHCLVNTAPYKGVLEGLKKLKEAGIKSIIVTNKVTSFAQKMADALGLSEYLTGVIGEGTCAEKKPSPVVWEYLKKEYGVEAEKTLMVGDSISDFRFAKVIGCPVCLALYGMGMPDELREWNGDYYADNFWEITKLILDGHSID